MFRTAVQAVTSYLWRRSEFSELSGIVGWGNVWEDDTLIPQRISIALDFTHSSDAAFIFSHGPASPELLTSDCFVSSHPDQPMNRLDISLPFSDGVIRSLEVRQISTPFIEEIDPAFRLRVMKHRDVHAVISAGPNSRIFDGKIAKIYEKDVLNDSTVPIVKIRDRDYTTDTVFVDLVRDTSSWEFIASSVTISDGSGSATTHHHVRIAIDPGSPDIILPQSLMSGYEEGYRFGGFYVPDISFSIGSSVIEIRSDQLLIPSEVDSSRVLIASNRDDVIILGRPLVRSVHRLYLDGARKRIGFRLADPQPTKPPIVFSPTNLAPFYGEPKLVSNSFFRVQHYRSDIDSGNKFVYVGRSRRPGKNCWVYAKLDALIVGIDFNTEVPHIRILINRPRGRIETETIRFRQFHSSSFMYVEDPQGPGEGMELRAFPGHSEICQIDYRERELDLPPAEVVHAPSKDDPQEEESCIICLGEIEEGNSRQRLRNCRHTFHQNCIQMWINQSVGQKRCPICSKPIHYKPLANDDTQG